MALFFLEYDLRKDRDYERLTDKLNEFNAVRILESLWCFDRLNTSAADLRDFFKGYIDNDDGLIVAEVSQWATYRTDGTPNDLPSRTKRTE